MSSIKKDRSLTRVFIDVVLFEVYNNKGEEEENCIYQWKYITKNKTPIIINNLFFYSY